jgi:hypothetical protein
VLVEGVVEISDDLDEVRRWAARIGGRSGALRPGHTTWAFDVAD